MSDSVSWLADNPDPKDTEPSAPGPSYLPRATGETVTFVRGDAVPIRASVVEDLNEVMASPSTGFLITRTEVLLPMGIERLNRIFCGCGNVELAWEAVLDELERCEANHRDRIKSQDRVPPDRETGEWYVMAYLLCHLDLTEHGGSVDWSWLTGTGVEALEFLRKYGTDWKDNPGYYFRDSKGGFHSQL